jgi:hypothetical protein
MNDLTANLAIMLDENSEHDAYKTATGLVIQNLARAYVKQKEVRGRQILVVSSAADFDHVALPLGNELQALGAKVKFCCVSYSWYTWADGRHDPDWRATYRESFGDSNFDIAVAMAVVNEPAELITIANAAVVDNRRWEAKPLEYSSIDIILAATVPGVREVFEGDATFKRSRESQATVIGIVKPEIRSSGPVSPSMKRAGVTETLKSGHIYPQYLLSRRSFDLPGHWEGSRPTPPGSISDADDMLHDFEEIDRRNAGILTDAKRATIIRAAKLLGYSVDNERGMSSLAVSYAVSIEDVMRALTEPKF